MHRIRSLLFGRCARKPPTNKPALERLPTTLFDEILSGGDAADALRVSVVCRSLRGRVQRYVGAARTLFIPWPRDEREALPRNLVVLLLAAKSLVSVHFGRCGAGDAWRNRPMMELVAKIVFANAATLERVELPWGEVLEKEVTALMWALASCPRLIAWPSVQAHATDLVKAMACTCTHVERLGFATRRHLAAFVQRAPRPERVTHLAVLCSMSWALPDEVAAFVGVRELVLSMDWRPSAHTAFTAAWPRLARLESLTLRVDVMGAYAKALHHESEEGKADRLVAAPDWILPRLERLTLKADGQFNVRFQTRRLTRLAAGSDLQRETLSSIVTSAAATLQRLDYWPDHHHGMQMDAAFGTTPDDHMKYARLRSLHAQYCDLGDLWGRARQFPQLARLVLNHATEPIAASLISAFMEETAEWLEWLQIGNSTTLSPSVPTSDAPEPRRQVVMRRLVFLQVASDVFLGRECVFACPSIVHVVTDDAACPCRPAVDWAGGCPALSRCLVHTGQDRAEETRMLKMTRVDRVPLASLPAPPRWMAEEATSSVRYTGNMGETTICVYRLSAPLLVLDGATVCHWALEFLVPDSELSDGSRRLLLSVAHRLGTGGVRIAHAIGAKSAPSASAFLFASAPPTEADVVVKRLEQSYAPP